MKIMYTDFRVMGYFWDEFFNQHYEMKEFVRTEREEAFQVFLRHSSKSNRMRKQTLKILDDFEELDLEDHVIIFNRHIRKGKTEIFSVDYAFVFYPTHFSSGQYISNCHKVCIFSLKELQKPNRPGKHTKILLAKINRYWQLKGKRLREKDGSFFVDHKYIDRTRI